MIRIALTLVPLLLLACTTYRTAEEVARRSRVEYDPYEKTTWVTSPEEGTGEGHGHSLFTLRTLVRGRAILFHQVYVVTVRPDWVFLERAVDRKGLTLDCVVIGRKARPGGIEEHVAVNVPDAYLRSAAAGEGLDLKIAGTAGQTIVTLPAFFVEGFLARVDDVTAEQARPAE